MSAEVKAEPTEVSSCVSDLGDELSDGLEPVAAAGSEPSSAVGGQFTRSGVQQPYLDPEKLLELAVEPLKEQRRALRDMLPKGFYVSIDRVRGMRRLHSLECYRTPSADFTPWEFLGTSAPDVDLYDSVCRSCFRAGFGEPVLCRKVTLESDDEFSSESSEDAVEGIVDADARERTP